MTGSLLQFWFLLHLISRNLHGSWKWNAVWSVSTPVNRNVTELSATLALGVQQFHFRSLPLKPIPKFQIGSSAWASGSSWTNENTQGQTGGWSRPANDTQTQREAARALNAKTFNLRVHIPISDSAFWSTEFQRPVLYV